MPVVTALGHTSDRTLADLVADREARTPTAAAELVVPRKRDLLRQLDERADRLRRAADMVLMGRERTLAQRLASAPVLRDPVRLILLPARTDLAQRQEAIRRLERDAVARRRERLEDFSRRLRQLNPLEVLRLRQRGLDERQLRWARSRERVIGFGGRELERVEALRARMRTSIDRTLRESDRGLVLRAQRLRSLGTQETLDRGFSITRDAAGRVLRTSHEVEPGAAVRVALARGVLDCTVEERRP
jgi:exodeoxyribonuclease VII large subunit